jgi:hypothetical protein
MSIKRGFYILKYPQCYPKHNIGLVYQKMKYLPYFCAKIQVQHDYGIQSIFTLRKTDII